MRRPCTATKSSPHSPQLEKARVQQQRPNAAKKKKKKWLNGCMHALLFGTFESERKSEVILNSLAQIIKTSLTW